MGCHISGYFGPAAQFIHTALEGGGKVVINCQMGVSRSSVLAMAYMILVRQWSVLHTITEFRWVLIVLDILPTETNTGRPSGRGET